MVGLVMNVILTSSYLYLRPGPIVAKVRYLSAVWYWLTINFSHLATILPNE